jgi:hypothetical protein
MHFAINRVQQTPISDINEFEDQQIEYAKELQDEGTRYTYDIFQRQLMQRAHMDPELFHLRDKDKRDIYRRIMSHLKSELEFKRAEFDTIKHNHAVSGYNISRKLDEETAKKLGNLDKFIDLRNGELSKLLTARENDLNKFTLPIILKLANQLDNSKADITTGFSSKNEGIRRFAARLLIKFNDTIRKFREVIKKKINQHQILDEDAIGTLEQLVQPLEVSKLAKEIPVTTPHRTQAAVLADQAAEHAAEAEYEEEEDAEQRAQHQKFKQLVAQGRHANDEAQRQAFMVE